MKWFHALMPKEDRFFELFRRHAQTLKDGAGALRQLLNEGGDNVPTYCQQIMDHEHAADEIATETLEAIRRSFITPIDRGDIKELTTSLDDAIDQMQKTAKAILLFEARDFDPDMKALGELIVETAAITYEVVELMADMRKNAGRLNTLTAQVIRLESKSDDLYDAGMRALYHGRGRQDPMAYIAGAEIYDHLEKVMDRFEDVANRISGVLLENL